jgi:hypothetical protein
MKVCIDVDATIAAYKTWEGVGAIGDPLPGAREFLEALEAKGLHITIYSTRTNTEVNCLTKRALKKILQGWLKRWRLPYHEIYVDGGKPHAKAFVDDRAVSCRPQENPDAFKTALADIEKLLH